MMEGPELELEEDSKFMSSEDIHGESQRILRGAGIDAFIVLITS